MLLLNRNNENMENNRMTYKRRLDFLAVLLFSNEMYHFKNIQSKCWDTENIISRFSPSYIPVGRILGPFKLSVSTQICAILKKG